MRAAFRHAGAVYFPAVFAQGAFRYPVVFVHLLVGVNNLAGLGVGNEKLRPETIENAGKYVGGQYDSGMYTTDNQGSKVGILIRRLIILLFIYLTSK